MEEYPGYQLFYNLTPGNNSTWVNVSALNPTIDAGTTGAVQVPNSTGITSISDAQVTLNSAWAAGPDDPVRLVRRQRRVALAGPAHRPQQRRDCRGRRARAVVGAPGLRGRRVSCSPCCGWPAGAPERRGNPIAIRIPFRASVVITAATVSALYAQEADPLF
ncbi:MAG: hypothetical protein WDO13_01345 [Verrucomicrobiota bacterium]